MMKCRHYLLGVLAMTCQLPQTSLASTLLYPKIIGGYKADTQAWPWMTALIFSDSSSTVFCGGTLVASNWVLTAAHCVFDEYPADSKNYILTDKASFDVLVNRAQLNTTGGERVGISDIKVHPGFDHGTLANDVALLKLNTPISSVAPVETLPDFSGLDEAGQNQAIALGWGTISATRSVFPTTLQEVKMPIISNAICQQALRGIEDTMFCAGPVSGGVDTCEGDSGGPLIVYDPVRNNYQQAGITSFGEAECAAPGKYGVYTRLDLFKGFISDTICSADMKPARPTMRLSTQGQIASAEWTTSPAASGYRLNYAPYPSGYPIASMEVDGSGKISVPLPKGSAFYVAINAYKQNCRSDFSNIEHFVIQ